MMKNKKAFTLVELIVVITILAILWAIAFFTIQNYTSQARDSSRVANTANIKKWLEIIHIDNWVFPQPEWNILTWSINWHIVSFLWEFWRELTRITNMWDIPSDPLAKANYMYWVSRWADFYQLWLVMEDSSNLRAKVDWNYPWLISYSTLSWNCIANLPSLLFNNTWNIDFISDTAYLVTDYWPNLPYTSKWYKDSSIQKTDSSELIKIITNSDSSYITWCLSNVNKDNFDTTFLNTWLLLSFNTQWFDPNETENIKNSIKKTVLGETPMLLSNNTSTNNSSTWTSLHLANIKITNTNTWDLVEHQISFSMDTQSLISSSKLNSTCWNINFFDSDENTALNYWIEPWTCNSSNTIFYIKVPQIPTWDKTIYAKLTNLSDSNNSTPETIFELFDDFNWTEIDTSKWIKTTSSYISWSVLYKNADNTMFKSMQTFWTNYEFLAKCKFLNNPWDKNNSVWIIASNNSLNFGIEHYSANLYFNLLAQNTYSMRTNTNYILWSYSPDWHILSIKRFPDKIIASINWVSKEYISSNSANVSMYFRNYWQIFWWCDWAYVKKLSNSDPIINVTTN